jgi:hypothetical protein
MAWLAVDYDGSEYVYSCRPQRFEYIEHLGLRNVWNSPFNTNKLPKGSIKRLIGRELTWDDEPFEFVEISNEPILTNP